MGMATPDIPITPLVPKDEQIANLRKELTWQREWRLRMTQERNELRRQLREVRAAVDEAITTLGGYTQ